MDGFARDRALRHVSHDELILAPVDFLKQINGIALCAARASTSRKCHGRVAGGEQHREKHDPIIGRAARFRDQVPAFCHQLRGDAVDLVEG